MCEILHTKQNLNHITLNQNHRVYILAEQNSFEYPKHIHSRISAWAPQAKYGVLITIIENLLLSSNFSLLLCVSDN